MNTERDFDNYIIQLEKDMKESARNLPAPNVMSEFDEESLPEELKMFANVERFLNGKADRISAITNIDTAAFPPPNQLTDAQTVFLCDEIIRLLNAFCFYADFPKGLPAEIKYTLLRLKWDEKVVYNGEGMTCFEFCDYEPDRCPFPVEYCHCKDLDDFDSDSDMI